MAARLPDKLDAWFYKLGTNNSSQIATAVLAGFKMFFIPFAALNDKKASPEQRKYAAARDFTTEVFAVTLYTGVTGLAQKFLTAPLCRRYFRKKAEMIEQRKITGVSLSKDELNILKNVNSKLLYEAGMQEISSFIDKDGKRIFKHQASEAALEHVKTIEKITSKLQNSWKELPQNTVWEKIKNAFSSQSKIQNPIEVFKNTRINISQISVWLLALSVIPALCNSAAAPLLKHINKKSNRQKTVNKLSGMPVQHPEVFRSLVSFKNNPDYHAAEYYKPQKIFKTQYFQNSRLYTGKMKAV